MATSAACAELCRRWLVAHGLDYSTDSRAAFARAHPGLCGRGYHLTLRGYEHWLARGGCKDDLETFARYLSPRFERAMGVLASADSCGVSVPITAAREISELLVHSQSPDVSAALTR